jgi:hypothetical protein
VQFTFACIVETMIGRLVKNFLSSWFLLILIGEFFFIKQSVSFFN